MESSCLPPVGSFSAGNMSPDQILHAATAVTMPAKPILPTGRRWVLVLEIKRLNAFVPGVIGSFSAFELFFARGEKEGGEREKRRDRLPKSAF